MKLPVFFLFFFLYREENADSDAGISKHARIKDGEHHIMRLFHC